MTQVVVAGNGFAGSEFEKNIIAHETYEKARRAPAPPHARQREEGTLYGGAKRMLAVMAQYPKIPFDRVTLGILADMKAGTGGYNNCLSELRKSGYIQDVGQKIAISLQGRQAAGQVGPPASAADVRQIWRSKFTGGAKRMFDHLERSYPSRVGRQDLAAAAQMSYGTGGFNNSLSELRTKHLLDEERDGIRLSPVLFLEGF